MQAHPIMESSRRWIPVLLMVLVAIGVQAWLLTAYAGVDLLSALVDGAVSIGLFCGLAYLSWFVIGFVSSVQTEIIVSVLAILFWLADLPCKDGLRRWPEVLIYLLLKPCRSGHWLVHCAGRM